MCSRVLTFLVENKELLRAEKFLNKYIFKITLINATAILLFLYFIDRSHIDKVYVAPFISFMIINVLLQKFLFSITTLQKNKGDIPDKFLCRESLLKVFGGFMFFGIIGLTVWVS